MIAVKWAHPKEKPVDRGPILQPIERIIREVGKQHGFTYSQMIGQRRQRDLVEARQAAYWRCKVETGASYPVIGRAFGNRDHSTILHGVAEHEARQVAIEQHRLAVAQRSAAGADA